MDAKGNVRYIKLADESPSSSADTKTANVVRITVVSDADRPSDAPYQRLAGDPKEAPELIRAVLNHVNAEYPRTRCYSIVQNGAVGGASIACMWLYVEPTLKFCEENKLDTANTVLTLIGNTLPSALVMGNVLIHYSSFIAGKRDIRNAMPEFLDPRKMTAEKLDFYIIVIGGVVSAVPLMFPVFQSSEELPFYAQLIKGGITLAAYTGNHLLAMAYILSNRLTRGLFLSPGLILYYPLYEWPRWKKLSEEEKYTELLAEQTDKDQNQLFALFNQQYQRSVKAIFAKLFTREMGWNPLNWGYKLSVPQEVRDAMNNPDKFQGHIELIKYGMSLLVPPPPTPEPSNFLKRCFKSVKAAAASCVKKAEPVLSPINTGLQYGTFAVGGIVSAAGTAGFLMSGINLINEKIHNEAAALVINSPPIFATAVLCGKFGGDLVEGIYNYFIDTLKGENDVPLAIKFYPKSVLTQIAIVAVLSKYSPQTAMWLVQKNFADSDYREILYNCAEYGIAGYGFIHQLELVLASNEFYAYKKGTPDQKIAVRLKYYGQKISSVAASVDLDIFEKEFIAMSPDLRTTVLGISETEFQQLIDHDGNLQKKLIADSQKVRCCPSCFFPAPRETAATVGTPSKTERPASVSANEGINSSGGSAAVVSSESQTRQRSSPCPQLPIRLEV